MLAGTDGDGVAAIVDDLILAINGSAASDTDNDITAAAVLMMIRSYY